MNKEYGIVNKGEKIYRHYSFFTIHYSTKKYV